jgi:hypothetical protein
LTLIEVKRVIIQIVVVTRIMQIYFPINCEL